MRNVPYLDYHKINEQYMPEYKEAFSDFLDSGHYVLGDNVKSFEDNFAKYCEVKHCIGVGSGLSALEIILAGYIYLGKLNHGDKVIVPANTFIATALAVSNVGLEPIFVDVMEHGYNIDFRDMKEEDLLNAKAVIVVHLYGTPADTYRWMDYASDRGDFLVIEDAAQAHGAKVDGFKAGNLANAGAFSFYPGKNLGALGDAGCITTNNDELACAVRTIRNYGSSKKYMHTIKGTNSRMDELQAAFLNIKLKNLDEIITIRKSIAKMYVSEIISDHVLVGMLAQGSVRHIFPVQVQDRKDFMQHCTDHGVETMIHYPMPIHKQVAYTEHHNESYPNAEEQCDTYVSIPCNEAMSFADVAHVINVIGNYKGPQ